MATPGQIALLTADAEDLALTLANSLVPQWGIFLFGVPVIASSQVSQLGLGGLAASIAEGVFGSFLNGSGLDFNTDQFSVVDFSFKQDYVVAQYQVENGGFQNYDKVQEPFDIRMRVAAGGSEANRQALIEEVGAAANTLNLYDVVTPEQIYQSCNITHWDYAKAAIKGAGLIVVDIWLTEIRVTSTAQFTNTTSPTDQGQVGTGQTFAVPPPNQLQFAVGGAT